MTRLATFVEVDDTVLTRQISVSARHEAALMNGGRVLLLTDRGWSASGPPNIWALTSVEDIADTARLGVSLVRSAQAIRAGQGFPAVELFAAVSRAGVGGS